MIVQLLSATQPAPLVFVMDDAQWADEASSQLLERLARECATRGKAMVEASYQWDAVAERIAGLYDELLRLEAK